MSPGGMDHWLRVAVTHSRAGQITRTSDPPFHKTSRLSGHCSLNSRTFTSPTSRYPRTSRLMHFHTNTSLTFPILIPHLSSPITASSTGPSRPSYSDNCSCHLSLVSLLATLVTAGFSSTFSEPFGGHPWTGMSWSMSGHVHCVPGQKNPAKGKLQPLLVPHQTLVRHCWGHYHRQTRSLYQSARTPFSSLSTASPCLFIWLPSLDSRLLVTNRVRNRVHLQIIYLLNVQQRYKDSRLESWS